MDATDRGIGQCYPKFCNASHFSAMFGALANGMEHCMRRIGPTFIDSSDVIAFLPFFSLKACHVR
jgi:hypothetical protein